jgi:hypothetical protein
MAQYTVFPTDATYIEVEDSIGMKFRLKHSPSIMELTLQQTLTPTGFDGSYGSDYIIVESYQLPSLPGAQHRVGVRDGHWVIDQTYDPDILGFSGTEGIDWDNIEEHKLP